MVEADSKREQIVEGAIRRFSHFGINKTTMAEIADDLAVSKPAIYYYFPDKQHLVTAVADKIISEYLYDVETSFKQFGDPAEALLNLIDLRRNFIQKYFMLHMGDEFMDTYLKATALQQLLKNAKEKEISIVAESLKKGIGSRQFKDLDTVKTAALFLEVLRGLRASMKIEKLPFPDESSFEELLEKQKQAAAIFLNGIKNHQNISKAQ